MSDYDVVVIGAGNGGLTSALGLAKKGLKVMLLERHNIPGGCATSFIRGRFEFEVALHQLSGLGTEDFPGPLRNTLEQLGVMEKLDFIQMDNLYRVIMPESLDITLKADRPEAVAALKERFPKESSNIDRFFDLLYDFCTQWIHVTILRDPKASKDKFPVYFKNALKSTQEVFDDFFHDPLLQAAIGVYWSYQGLPPSKITFNDFAITLWAYLEFKPWHLKGGSQALSNALLNTYLEAGGEVRFNCGAKKIIVSNGQVKGVITEHGDEISTNRVVSNAGTATTYVELIDSEHIPNQLRSEFGTMTLGTSFVSVFMGFDKEPHQMDINHTTSFIVGSTDAEQVYAKGKTLLTPDWLLFSCYDVDDPDFSPKGLSQASLVTMSYAKPWLKIPPQHYHKIKYDYAQKMVDQLVKIYPGIKNHIEAIDVGTPLTHMRYLGHPGGSAYGFDRSAKDSEIFRTKKSPIKGLYLAGAWPGMGGFQPSLTSGAQVAKTIVKSMETKGGKS